MTVAQNRRLSRAQLDLAIVGGLTAAFALLSVRLDLSESLLRWAHSSERLQLDELPQILLVLAALLSWYAWRRTSEMKAELARRRAAEAELAQALEENRRLGRQAVDAQESEQRNLAREMHDELGQYLVAIRLDAAAIGKDSIDDGCKADRAHTRESAAAIVRHVDHLQAVVRGIIGRLRPAGLDVLGLAAALESCVEAWRPRLPDVDIHLNTEGDLERLGEEVDLVLYRLAQECLTNVSKHASARQVQIELVEQCAADGVRTIRFLARDDGRGAALPLRGRGFGLAGMRERVQSLGGDFAFSARPGAGFRVTATLRLPGAAAQGKPP
jgi:signal transduction histidine kinase